MVFMRSNPVFVSSLHQVVILVLAALLALSALGCGGDDAANAPGALSVEDEIGTGSLIAHSDRVYTVDDFLEVGWKKSKHLETDTLENAIDAWYGFYNRKDIELRFYESHDTAIAFGVEPAQETTQRGTGGRIGAATVWTPNISLYGAYAVAGNVVMMCELELASCETLIDALK